MRVEDLPPKMQQQIIEKLGLTQKKSKYSNKKTTIDEIKFDSIKEANRYAELKLEQSSGVIEDLRLQVKFRLYSDITYVADFVYFDLTKKKYIVEDVKGVKTDVYTMKKKMFADMYGIDILET